jgi:hypothetical protein
VIKILIDTCSSEEGGIIQRCMLRACVDVVSSRMFACINSRATGWILIKLWKEVR